MKTKLLLAGALLLSTVASAAPASAASWELLGTRVVSDRMDHDVIGVPGHRRYRQMKICVYRHPVHFYDVDVYYENGGHQDISVRSRINPGHCTRNIDLNGWRRDIRRISLRYEEASFGRRRTATVRVYGRR